MCQELGYEDEGEFEDALKGTFNDFLDNLPHVVKKVENDRSATWLHVYLRATQLRQLRDHYKRAVCQPK